uniref:Uncharacterized protein n=1 Tax=Lepeophtheirus salmonis TaxID=72036 RepID=A0A0K2T7Z5_LEPSM
MLNYNISIVNQ